MAHIKSGFETVGQAELPVKQPNKWIACPVHSPSWFFELVAGKRMRYV
jgi:hypothetical protein